MITPDTIVSFWDKAGPEAWYKKDAAFDAQIRALFLPVWEAACTGALRDWMDSAQGCLARLILLDQFPRNMFREDPRAFATDGLAVETAHHMIAQGWDSDIAEPMRQFCFMPFMHSEALADQDYAVEVFETRMEEGDNDLHAHVHREIIRRHGRFPYRNRALGRANTSAEQSFLDDGGYGAILNELKDGQA